MPSPGHNVCLTSRSTEVRHQVSKKRQPIRNSGSERANPPVLTGKAVTITRGEDMYHTTEQALAAIHETLAAQDKQFAAFVEAFSELPLGTCLDVNPNVLDAID